MFQTDVYKIIALENATGTELKEMVVRTDIF